MNIVSKIGDERIGDERYIDRIGLIGTARISFIGFVEDKTDSLITRSSNVWHIKTLRSMFYTGKETITTLSSGKVG